MDEICDFRRRQAFPTRNSSSSFRLSLISGYFGIIGNWERVFGKELTEIFSR